MIARTLIEHFKVHPDTGVYLQIGNTAKQVFRLAGVDPSPNWISESALGNDTVSKVAKLKTTLRRLTQQEFDGLFRRDGGPSELTHNSVSLTLTLIVRCSKLVTAWPSSERLAIRRSDLLR